MGKEGKGNLKVRLRKVNEYPVNISKVKMSEYITKVSKGKER